MGITVGLGGAPIYMPPGGISGSPYATLLGLPVVAIEHADTIGTVGDIMLLSLSEYLLIDKGGIDAASSMHVKFITDEMTFRFTYRIDGQPIWNSAITPFKGTITKSPYIALASRD
jgi:HK97 family phage major capsid protein